MLVNIKSKLNINILNSAIERYINTLNYTLDNYLIMNANTAMDLRELSRASSDYCQNGNVETYRGFRIASCSALRYGEVEIR